MHHGRGAHGQPQKLLAVTALMALGAGVLVGAGPSDAAVATVGGSAEGATVAISTSRGQRTSAGPLAAVVLPSAGGAVSDSVPSLSVGRDDPSAPFGGRFLRTGAVSVAAQGRTGTAGGSTSSATASAVELLGGALEAQELRSTCTASEASSARSTKLGGARLVVSATKTIDLPAEPAPNTTFSGSDASSGDTFTVVLNEQDPAAGTVTAVHVKLEGRSATGDIFVARSACSTTATSAASRPAAPPETVDPASASKSTTGGSPALQSGPATGMKAQLTSKAGASSASPAAAAGAPEVATAAARAAAVLPAAVGPVASGAFGFSATLSLFGTPPGNAGPTPTVTLPAAGSSAPVTASAPSGRAAFGPAVVFSSGELKVSTQGTAGSSTSSASASGIGPDTSFTAGSASSSCSASGAGVNGTTSIANGKLVTKTNPDGSPATTVDIPASPAPNTERTGTLDNVGDSFRVVFNEQQVTADSIVVNAVHMFLLGPAATGELIISQSRCSKVAAAGTPTGGTPAAGGTNTGGTNTGGTNTGGTGRSGTGGSRSGTGTTGTGAGARTSMANTGFGVFPPLLLSFSLLVLGFGALHGSARLQAAGVAARSPRRSPPC